MPDVRLLRSDLAAFAAAVGWPLTRWQLDALALDAVVTCIVAPRQSGKSRSLAVLAMWRAFREPDQLVLVVSASEDASRRLLRTVRDVAAASPLLAGSVVDEQSQLVVLSNGSRVLATAASERAIRGWSATDLLLDEAALLPEPIVAAALPTVAARAGEGARVVMASSATTASGPFYDHAVRGEAGSEHTRTFRWALADCEWIAPSWIEAQRESMSEQRFAAEYEGVFASGADAVFTRRALDLATADYVLPSLAALEGPARVLAGVDWGQTVDRSALVAIARLPVAERAFAVCCAHRWPAGAPLPAVVAEIAESGVLFDTIVAEMNGLGGPCAQLLWQALARRAPAAGGARPRGPVLVDPYGEGSRVLRPRDPEAFTTRRLGAHTTADMKAAAFSSLRLLLEQGRLILPASAEDLRRELLMLRVSLTPTGGEHIAAGSGHDDLAMALALAAVPYRPRSGSWRVLLAELANPRRPLPEPAVRASGEMVATGGGLLVPRAPAWVSATGSEITLAPRAPRAEPAHIVAARAAVQQALSTTREGGA